MKTYKDIPLQKARRQRFERTGNLTVRIEAGQYYCRVANANFGKPDENPEIILHCFDLEVLKLSIDEQLQANAEVPTQQ